MNQFQMVNRDTGDVVYQKEARGWRQFRIAYVHWAQTTQQGILPLELQEIVRVEPKPLVFTDNELRMLGRILSGQNNPVACGIAKRIAEHLWTRK